MNAKGIDQEEYIFENSGYYCLGMPKGLKLWGGMTKGKIFLTKQSLIFVGLDGEQFNLDLSDIKRTKMVIRRNRVMIGVYTHKGQMYTFWPVKIKGSLIVENKTNLMLRKLNSQLHNKKQGDRGDKTKKESLFQQKMKVLEKRLLNEANLHSNRKENFYNPALRMKRYIELGGFDLLFNPLDPETMVYIYIDGNKNNDNPNNHTWVAQSPPTRSTGIIHSSERGIEESIKILENKFDEYRVYGDERDLDFFKVSHDPEGPNCTVPIKVPYIYPELKKVQSNKLKLDPKVVENVIADFVKYKLRNSREVVIYRRIEDKMTDDHGIENNCAVPLSTYTLLNNSRRTNPTKAREHVRKILKNKETMDNYRYGRISEKEFEKEMKRVQEEFKNEREKQRLPFQLKNDNTLALRHIEKHVGKIEKSIHDNKFKHAPLSIHIIPKIHNQDYSALVTTGLSHAPMHAPGPMELFKYSELLIKLPLDWPLPIDVIKDDEFIWPIAELLSLMEYIHSHQQWFSDMHTYGNGNPPLPFAKNTGLCGFLFMFPLLSFPPEFCELKIDDSKSIIFLQLVPLYKEEMDIAVTEGSEALLERIENNEITEYVDIQRKNICGSSKPDFKPSETKGYLCPYCNTVLRGFKPEGIRCPSCKRVVVMDSDDKLISLDIPDEKPSVSKEERQKAEKFFMDGLNMLKQSKFEKALKNFSKATKLNPYDIRAHSVKIELLHKMRRYKEAADCVKEGMKYLL